MRADQRGLGKGRNIEPPRDDQIVFEEKADGNIDWRSPSFLDMAKNEVGDTWLRQAGDRELDGKTICLDTFGYEIELQPLKPACTNASPFS